MSKPTKEEMLRWLEDQNCPNDPIWPEHMPIYNAIHELIEKSDEGPVVSMKEIYHLIKDGLECVESDGYVDVGIRPEKFINRLNSLGISVKGGK